MRDQHLIAIERKIQRIRFYKKTGKIIFSILILTTFILISINLITSAKIDDLSKINTPIEQSIDKADKLAVIDDYELTTTYSGVESTQVQDMVITHYCSCKKCCGKTDGTTATGTQATAGRTIAVDPDVIPLGSQVLIDGNIYIAEDIGGAIKGNRIDIYCDSHSEAINRGKITREVTIK